MSHDIQGTFTAQGFAGPVPLLTAAECAGVLAHEASGHQRRGLDWLKGRAAADPFYAQLGSDERILRLLRPLLGDDIVLWGVDILRRRPDQVHPWHCDIESCAAEGGFVSVWIGIENASRDSTLNCVTRSHRFGRTLQDVAHGKGLKRGEATERMVRDWAVAFDPAAEIVSPDVHDGEAILFDGRLWHGTHNLRGTGTRTALLLQYAAASRPVRMIDFERLEWPFQFIASPRPPVIAVSGAGDAAVNRVVAAPLPDVAASVHPLHLPLSEGEDGWVPYPLFKGATASLSLMGCHVSVLSPGRSPHPPHAHVEEEILLVLDGEAEIVIASGADDPAPRRERLGRGMFSYYPAWQHHTLRNVSDRPVTYMMFKWTAAPSAAPAQPALGAAVFDASSALTREAGEAFSVGRLFDRPTGWLRRLHCHTTVLQPGAGYPEHADGHDVAIVLLEGTIETLGRRVDGSGVVYCARGTLHGMHNPGRVPARYVVFEFESGGAGAA